MLLVGPLGSIKSKLIVLQSHAEWVFKSSSWAALDTRLPPWCCCGALEAAPREKPSDCTWQPHCSSSVIARSLEGHFGLRAQLGADSAPLKSQGKIPPSAAAPGPGFHTRPLRWGCQQICPFLSCRRSEISLAVRKLLSSWCGKLTRLLTG